MFLGNFVKNSVSGEGKIYWENGDVCDGLIQGSTCSGKKTTASGTSTKGKFDFSFDHNDHQYNFGKLNLFILVKFNLLSFCF